MLKRYNLEENMVEIVSDAAMASSEWGDSRLIPVLVLDCSNNPGVIDLIEIHKDTPPGDVISTWLIKPFSNKFAYLRLKFIMPMNLTVIIPFELSKYSNLLDGIIQNNSVYLQDNIYQSVEDKAKKSKVLIEIPSATTFPKWEKLYLKTMTKKYKNKQNAKEHIADMRKIWSKRKVS